MHGSRATELELIRHAPVVSDGCLYGRRDLPADCHDVAKFDFIRSQVAQPNRIISSPAQRCLQTAAMLWPDEKIEPNADLWEQNFGDWEGLPFQGVPDLGPMTRDQLSESRPPNGESFADMYARIAPAIDRLLAGGDVTIVAHAGTVRVALALALGSVPAALAFEIEPLSLTRIARLPSGEFIIRQVNQCAPE